MEEYILNALHKGVMAQNEARIGSTIHVSNLVRFCPREYALLVSREFHYNPGQKVWPGLAYTFQMGHLIHDHIQGTLKKQGILHRAEIHMELPKKIYGEKVSGTCDGLLILEEDKYHILEIKSMGQEFTALMDPKPEHVCQINLYMWLAKKLKLGKVCHDHGYILYASKGHSNQPFKVFRVEYNADFIKEIEGKLKQVKTFSSKGTIPAKICNHAGTSMAKSCKCPDICFKEE